MAWAILAVALAVLTVGADLLVRGAARLAAAWGISPLIVGLTIVACGTSAPELVVSLHSTLSGQPDVALGNVVGSNIFNVLAILGASALIVPLRVADQFVRFDVPVMIALTAATLVLALDGRIGRIEGAALSLGLVGYLARAVWMSRRSPAGTDEDLAVPGPPRGSVAWSCLSVAAGLTLLVLGSRWFVSAAVDLARDFGVSELTIGLTVVAAGTSLPEAAASALAALRGERDIAVGNVVGSNIFNLLGVLGLSAALSGGGVAVSEAALRFDLPVMLGVAVVCLPICWTGQVVARWEGGLLLAYYVIYTGVLLVAATDPGRIAGPATLWGVAALTALPLLFAAVHAFRSRR
ncbi:calcium/sodium antiporter [Alienimonas chondri]|uniref:Sodium/calcium exchanger membrane region domain-containing protein n=1 Tax=Alienimonas chondri TaxID=2681879 RepID=A0ABX1VKD8_9PLAN|nr:calcium/sodium antiporter [Alienimonas chondri]NNJ27196.1 hypothetical protein [Alienimonas chondri]